MPTVGAPRQTRGMWERIVEVERGRWKYAAAKDQHVREVLGVSATRYYQLLDAMLDDAEAERLWPVEIKRLRRVREARRAVRSARSC